MTVGELIAKLSEVEDLNTPVSIVVGKNKNNCDIYYSGHVIVQEGKENGNLFVEICHFSKV